MSEISTQPMIDKKQVRFTLDEDKVDIIVEQEIEESKRHQAQDNATEEICYRNTTVTEQSFDSELQQELLKAPAENRTTDKLAEGLEVRLAKSTALNTDATPSLSPKSYLTEDSQASHLKVTQLYKRFKRDKQDAGPFSDWRSDHLLMTEDGS